MFFKQEINLLNDYESMPFPIHFENEYDLIDSSIYHFEYDA